MSGSPTPFETGEVAIHDCQDDGTQVLVVDRLDVRAHEFGIYETSQGSVARVFDHRRGAYPRDDVALAVDAGD